MLPRNSRIVVFHDCIENSFSGRNFANLVCFRTTHFSSSKLAFLNSCKPGFALLFIHAFGQNLNDKGFRGKSDGNEQQIVEEIEIDTFPLLRLYFYLCRQRPKLVVKLELQLVVKLEQQMVHRYFQE